MQKTTVYLPDDLKAAVEREAQRRSSSEAEVIRDAIRAAVSRPPVVPGIIDGEPIAALRRAPARFRGPVIIADTSGLLALFNRREPQHEVVARLVTEQRDPLVVSPYVAAELDYLVATRFGVTAELAVLGELTGGAYELAALGPTDVDRCAEVIESYRDQSIGLADASLVVLADRLGTDRLLTLDHRHFDVVRPIAGGRFTIVPG